MKIAIKKIDDRNTRKKWIMDNASPKKTIRILLLILLIYVKIKQRWRPGKIDYDSYIFIFELLWPRVYYSLAAATNK